jgi:hypothetical protein
MERLPFVAMFVIAFYSGLLAFFAAAAIDLFGGSFWPVFNVVFGGGLAAGLAWLVTALG